MTVKLDIPALADRIDPRKLDGWSEENVRPGSVFYCGVRDAIAASDALRSLTTALEIGRAMGIEAAAKVCEERAAELELVPEELRNLPDAIRINLSRQAADTIRSTAHAVDLEGLTERIARAWWETDSHDEEWDRGAWDSIPEDSREIVRKHARAVLARLGLHAREN